MPLGYDCVFNCGRSGEHVVAGWPVCQRDIELLTKLALQRVWDRQAHEAARA